MIRKLFLSGVALFTASAVAVGANLALQTGPVDPSNLRGTINALIQQINAGVGGLLNAQTGSTGTTAAATEQVLQTYTMPANVLSAAGQAVRVTCWGTTAANANTKQIKLYFGTSTVTSTATAANDKAWKIQYLAMRTGAATQAITGEMIFGTDAAVGSATIDQASGTDDLTAAVVIKCAGVNSAAAANDIVATGMITELIK